MLKKMILILLMAFLATACGEQKKDSQHQKTEKAELNSGQGAKNKGNSIKLSQIFDTNFGYSIKLPAGAKPLSKDEFSHTYSLVLPDGMNELNVHLTPNAQADLKGLARMATMMGSKKVMKQEEFLGGFLVIKAPEGKMNQEIWFAKKGPSKSVTVKCSGPPSHFNTLEAICTSLQVTK